MACIPFRVQRSNTESVAKILPPLQRAAERGNRRRSVTIVQGIFDILVRRTPEASHWFPFLQVDRSEGEYKGRIILVRYVWLNLPKVCANGAVLSPDGGKTWEVNWICELTR